MEQNGEAGLDACIREHFIHDEDTSICCERIDH